MIVAQIDFASENQFNVEFVNIITGTVLYSCKWDISNTGLNGFLDSKLTELKGKPSSE
jgi:hypothetical protein